MGAGLGDLRMFEAGRLGGGGFKEGSADSRSTSPPAPKPSPKVDQKEQVSIADVRMNDDLGRRIDYLSRFGDINSIEEIQELAESEKSDHLTEQEKQQLKEVYEDLTNKAKEKFEAEAEWETLERLFEIYAPSLLDSVKLVRKISGVLEYVSPATGNPEGADRGAYDRAIDQEMKEHVSPGVSTNHWEAELRSASEVYDRKSEQREVIQRPQKMKNSPSKLYDYLY